MAEEQLRRIERLQKTYSKAYVINRLHGDPSSQQSASTIVNLDKSLTPPQHTQSSLKSESPKQTTPLGRNSIVDEEELVENIIYAPPLPKANHQVITSLPEFKIHKKVDNPTKSKLEEEYIDDEDICSSNYISAPLVYPKPNRDPSPDTSKAFVEMKDVEIDVSLRKTTVSPPKKMLLYSCIATSSCILVDCVQGNTDHNFREVIHSMIPNLQLDQFDKKITYSGNQYLFHTLIHRDIAYICAADKELGYTNPYKFLNEIKSRFGESSLIVRAQHASEFDFTREFQSVLDHNMQEYSSYSGFGNISVQVQEVKNIMNENIEKVLQRGANLEELLDATSILEDSAITFRTQSKQVRKKYFWQNIKYWIILITLIVVIILIVLLWTCTIPIFCHNK